MYFNVPRTMHNTELKSSLPFWSYERFSLVEKTSVFEELGNSNGVIKFKPLWQGVTLDTTL